MNKTQIKLLRTTILIVLLFGAIKVVAQLVMNYQSTIIAAAYEIREPDLVLAAPDLSVGKTEAAKVEEIKEERKLSSSINTTERVEEKVAEDDINYDDAYLLAQLLCAENGGNPDDECVLLTGIVVMKRVKSNRYPNTIRDVIYQKGQYACVDNGHINNDPTDRCLEIAEEILRFNLADNYPDGLVYQAEFEQGSDTYYYSGNQYFCLQ